METLISGLHSCKKENTPYVGDVKTFILEQRVGKSGKEWTKIKSAPATQGGRPYEIMSVAATDYSDVHGNISFNLELAPQGGNAPQQVLRSSQSVAGTPQNAPQSVPSNGWHEDRSARIERQHSQHMAILYATLKGSTELNTAELRLLIDWFQRDVGRTPGAVKPAAVEPEEIPSDDDSF